MSQNNTNKLLAPTNCPSCGNKLTVSKTGIDLFCTNFESCPDQIKFKLSYFCKRQNANIPGLSDKIIEKFITKLQIKDFYNLYDLPFDEISNWEGFGEKSVVNLKQSIEKSRNNKISQCKFLAALAIDGIGQEVAKLIVKHVSLK